MIISGHVLWGTAIASNDASHRVLTLNFFTTPAHPMGAGLETFELITLGANGIDRARTMQHCYRSYMETLQNSTNKSHHHTTAEARRS